MQYNVFEKLRCRMFSNRITQEDIAKTLGRGTTYISSRMRGIEPWSLDDMYKLCDYLEIPYTEMHEYFPKINFEESAHSGKKGKCAKKCKRRSA